MRGGVAGCGFKQLRDVYGKFFLSLVSKYGSATVIN